MMMIVKQTFFFILFILPVSTGLAQNKLVTSSGLVKDNTENTVLPYVNVLLHAVKDSAYIAGTITNEEGRFTLPNIQPGNYEFVFSSTGYITRKQQLFVGSLSDYLDVAIIELTKRKQYEYTIR